MSNSEFIPVVVLPYRVKMTYRTYGGEKQTTKTVLNCIDFKASSGIVYNDEITLANVKVVISYSNEPRVIELALNSQMDRLTFNAGNKFYEVLSIDGRDPLTFLNPKLPR